LALQKNNLQLLWIQQNKLEIMSGVNIMILWINGSFGVGKTETANELNKKIGNSFVYDPEMAGEFIWGNSPVGISRKGDFQDIPMWRDFNYQMLSYINNNYTGTIIVPMTIVRKEYYNQIIGRLINDGIPVKHFILLADKPTILSRLKKRGEEDNCWAAQQIDKCLITFAKDITDVIINTTGISIDEVATLILKKSNIN